MKHTFMTLMLLGALGTANAQIAARENVQQNKIANGLDSGKITPAEAARLERQQKNLNRTIARQKAANGGQLTQEQKYAAGNRQTAIKGDIYNAKNNGRTTTANSPQNDRIAAGIRDGSLNPSESSRILTQKAAGKKNLNGQIYRQRRD